MKNRTGKRIVMKPETIERRRREFLKSRQRSRADLIARLEEKAKVDPDGIWSELADDVKALPPIVAVG